MDEKLQSDGMLTDEIRFVIPRAFAARATLAAMRVSLARPLYIITYAVLAIVFAVFGLLGILPFEIPWWIIPAGLIGFYLLLLVLVFAYQVRITSTHLPVGSVLAARFGAEAFWERTPQGESIVRYDSYDHLWVRGDFVIFKVRRGPAGNILPAELIPDDDWLAYIWSQLAPRSR